jgi:hypothetical protein
LLGFVTAVYADKVIALWVRHQDPRWRHEVLCPGAPPGVFPITIKSISTKARLLKRPLHHNTRGGFAKQKAFSLTIAQLPVVPGFCVTGHKVQGLSVTALLIMEWGRDAEWPYVVLSRVTTRKGLFLLSPMQSHNYKRYIMKDAVYAEDQRIAALVRHTLSRLNLK